MACSAVFRRVIIGRHVRVGINYRFDYWGKAPAAVMAKY
jgi:hypothetical protein